MTKAHVSYLALIRGNRDFRLLWGATIVSLFGDWFNTIALYTLVERLTGSPLALGLVFIIKMGAYAVASPLAGVLADRYHRRTLLILSDLLRAVVVLGFLFIDSPEQVPILYVLVAAQMVAGSVFRPARDASLPNITTSGELLPANTLMASTWSVLAAIGAGVGGLAVEWLGMTWVFVIDSATYLLSAVLVARVAIPAHAEKAKTPLLRAAFGEIAGGVAYMVRQPEVGRIALAKGAWAIGGGSLVYMLALVGAEVGFAPEAVAIGLLYAARGLGTGLGPVLARPIFRDSRKWPLLMGFFMAGTGCAYILVANMPWTVWILLLVLVAHAASGTNWVFSTVLLQQRAQDSHRGRVFAGEWVLLTAMNLVALVVASHVLEARWLTLREGIFACAVVQLITGAVWVATIGIPELRRRSPVARTQGDD